MPEDGDDSEEETVDGQPVTDKAAEAGGLGGLALLVIAFIAAALLGGDD